MTHTALFTIFLLMLALYGGAVVYAFRMIGDFDREKKLRTRVVEVVEPSARPTQQMEEQYSLVKQVSKMDLFKARAAGLIGVDLQQAETYPIPWYTVPPISAAITAFLLFLASHPLGSHPLVWAIVRIGTPGIWLVITNFIFNYFTNGRNSKLVAQFPDALNSIVRCVRVGIPMGEALRTVARDAQEPTKTEFGILADKVTVGIPLDVALAELQDRVKLTEYQFFATALTLQARSGGGITQTLENLADVIRKRVGLKARGYALTAEARTSVYLLAALPFVTGTAIFFLQRPYILLLFNSPGGQSCLGAAILLMCIGLGIVQFMISNVLK